MRYLIQQHDLDGDWVTVGVPLLTSEAAAAVVRYLLDLPAGAPMFIRILSVDPDRQEASTWRATHGDQSTARSETQGNGEGEQHAAPQVPELQCAICGTL